MWFWLVDHTRYLQRWFKRCTFDRCHGKTLLVNNCYLLSLMFLFWNETTHLLIVWHYVLFLNGIWIIEIVILLLLFLLLCWLIRILGHWKWRFSCGMYFIFFEAFEDFLSQVAVIKNWLWLLWVLDLLQFSRAWQIFSFIWMKQLIIVISLFLWEWIQILGWTHLIIYLSARLFDSLFRTTHARGRHWYLFLAFYHVFRRWLPQSWANLFLIKSWHRLWRSFLHLLSQQTWGLFFTSEKCTFFVVCHLCDYILSFERFLCCSRVLGLDFVAVVRVYFKFACCSHRISIFVSGMSLLGLSSVWFWTARAICFLKLGIWLSRQLAFTSVCSMILLLDEQPVLHFERSVSFFGHQSSLSSIYRQPCRSSYFGTICVRHYRNASCICEIESLQIMLLWWWRFLCLWNRWVLLCYRFVIICPTHH